MGHRELFWRQYFLHFFILSPRDFFISSGRLFLIAFVFGKDGEIKKKKARKK